MRQEPSPHAGAARRTPMASLRVGASLDRDRVTVAGGGLRRWRPTPRTRAHRTETARAATTSVFCGSDQMLMRRFGSTPSQRLKFAFHTVPATGRTARQLLEVRPRGSSPRGSSRCRCRFGSFSVPRSDGRDLHAGRVEALEERAAVVIQVVVEHAARVHLEAVVHDFLLRIRVDEDLHRVVAVSGIVALLEARGDVRIVGVEADVERLRVPEQAGRASSAWRRSASPTGTAASRSAATPGPGRLVQLAVDRERRAARLTS